MILSDKTFRQFLRNGSIIVSPSWHESDIRPNGLRLHLGNKLLLPVNAGTVNPAKPQKLEFKEVDLEQNSYVLRPNAFVLGASLESIQTPRDIVCLLDGRSTLARLGLALHCTAGVLDNLYQEARNIVFEIKNMGPWSIELTHALPVAMAVFAGLTSEVEQNQQEQYAGQQGPTPPNLFFQIPYHANLSK